MVAPCQLPYVTPLTTLVVGVLRRSPSSVHGIPGSASGRKPPPYALNIFPLKLRLVKACSVHMIFIVYVCIIGPGTVDRVKRS